MTCSVKLDVNLKIAKLNDYDPFFTDPADERFDRFVKIIYLALFVGAIITILMASIPELQSDDPIDTLRVMLASEGDVRFVMSPVLVGGVVGGIIIGLGVLVELFAMGRNRSENLEE